MRWCGVTVVALVQYPLTRHRVRDARAPGHRDTPHDTQGHASKAAQSGDSVVATEDFRCACRERRFGSTPCSFIATCTYSTHKGTYHTFDIASHARVQDNGHSFGAMASRAFTTLVVRSLAGNLPRARPVVRVQAQLSLCTLHSHGIVL